MDIILLCNSLISTKATSVITYQIVKPATSTGPNYHGACRARSKAEFFSKICIVVEEADETEYWLEIIEDTDLSKNKSELSRLKQEVNEIIRIMTAAKNTSFKPKN